jgi:DNA-binding NtrC family response regulator
MPRLTGLEVLGQLQQAGQLVPSILMTGNPSREIEMAAMDLGVITMLHKPIPPEVLRITVQQFFSLPPDHPGPSQGSEDSPNTGEPW